MDYRRTVEIHCSKYEKGGTGYLVQDTFILTAYHVVSPPKEETECEAELVYDIRFLEDSNTKQSEWLCNSASLRFYDQANDIAVLQLSGYRPSFLNDKKSYTKFGELDDKTHTAEGYGFPKVQKFGKRQNPENLKGELSRIAGLREKQLRLQVTSLLPKKPEDWQGISGTALFVQGHLIGVVTETNKGFGEKALWATPISLFSSIPDFNKLIDTGRLKIIHPRNVFYDFFVFALKIIPWVIGIPAVAYVISLSLIFFDEQANKELIQSKKLIVDRCSQTQDSVGNCPERVEALKVLIEKKVILSEVNLEKANLEGINLNGAQLPNSNFSNASLFKASLVKSNLSGGKSDLFRADLRLANLSYSNLSEVVLYESNLSGANLNNVNFFRAKAPSANFSFANLSKSNLTEANLQGSNLQGADLREADLRKADLQNANLQNANLQNADLRGITISQNAIYDNNHFVNQIMSACFWEKARYSDDVLKLLPKEDNKNPRADCSFW
jgi:uncharacterized protein YjbI with pentapeptide repeats